MPPLPLMQLAALTPPDIEVEIIDENVEAVGYQETDLVGISSMTSSAPRAYQIADTYREKGIPVILGGIHPSILPEEAAVHADSVVIGEADKIWPQIFQDFRDNSLRDSYRGSEIPDLKDLTPLRRDLIKKDKYFFTRLLQTSRGCPMNCDFCSVSDFNGIRMRHRPIDQIMEEIEAFSTIWKRRFLLFADDNIVGDKPFARRLFDALKSTKIRWGSMSSIEIARDPDFLQLARESGCRALFIGFESIRQDALQEIHKRYKVREYEELIKRIQDLGITLEGSFIFGFDGDNKDVFKQTVEFCYRNNFNLVQFSVLTPFPGTRLFANLKKVGRILTYDWTRYDAFHCVYQPAKMSPEELQEGIIDAYQQFYSNSSIVKRLGSTALKIKWPYSILMSMMNYDFKHFAF
ncbi:MAG: B12-binding domain-containing radical SAM protein [Deltaproteobacteria bacterium]|nr:MAG: B12-binding domain-containing radical SAM protein [Deltaproteobacteria bacterium]